MLESIYNYFIMDGYGIFIWVAFGLSFVILAGLFVQSIRLFRSSEKALEDLQIQVRQDEK
ncbi:MAG: heme exporter protein CcmD [Rhodospirillales bacterium]|mgnify:CR=1 FL=1|nr:heme exporter protein CcmD [Rhodospirillales bacterium]